jgi:hypothetical protein
MIRYRRHPLPILLACALTGCGDRGEPSIPGESVCRVAQPPLPLAPQISEASGAAISRRFPGVIWTHNDSGGDPELFAVDPLGQLVGRLTVTGAGAVDWEDIALAECAVGDCLYVGDIGDNAADRSSIELYRIPEPDPRIEGFASAERFRVRYPDGPRDSESLFVLPGERIHLVTRGRGAPIVVYEYPGSLRSEEVVELRAVRTLSETPVPREDQVTGADASRDGRWVALRTSTALLLYTADQLLNDADGGPLRVELGPLSEPQGEAVAIGSGGAVVLTSEGGDPALPGSITVLFCAPLARGG